MALELAVAIPVFVCSVLSFVATSTLAFCYFMFPPERHFRQALIVNLLISDWLNSLNNSVSGAVALSRRNDVDPLAAGPACTANGYIGQWTVQATDFNILVISLAVLLTVTRTNIALSPPWWQVALVCAVPWIPGAITSNVALGLGIYQPVSGNWCWIKKDLLERYLLTHGWRWAIFGTTIAIYTFIYIYLTRMYKKVYVITGPDSASSGQPTPIGTVDSYRIKVRSSIFIEREDEGSKSKGESSSNVGSMTTPLDGSAEDVESLPSFEVDFDLDNDEPLPRVADPDPSIQLRPSIPASSRNVAIQGGKKKRRRSSVSDQKRERYLRKMLLLNGYPIMYIILWVPGMVNRICEVIEYSPVWLRALTCLTQLVGFANSLTYAWNENLFKRKKRSYKATTYRFTRR